MSDPREEHKSAKAEAAAARARAKSLRPWFKKKRFIIPIALVLMIFISQAVKGGDQKRDNSSSPSQSSQQEDQTQKKVGIGSPAVDGKFSFTVTKVQCGISSVGSDYLNVEPQGQFCRIALSIENIGNEPQTMFADDQYLYDSQGRKFSVDNTASIYDDGSDSWLKEINPGNTLSQNLIFDVPVGTALDHIELHDSTFSSGVEVSLN